MKSLAIPILLLLVIAVVLRSDLFFYFLYIIVGLLLVARFWLWQVVKHVRWERSVQPAAFPNEPVPVTIAIKNDGLLPVSWVSLHESLPPALHTPPMVSEVRSLSWHDQQMISYTIQSNRRGYYRIGPLEVRSGDMLGFFERKLGELSPVGLTIYPTIVPLVELGLPASLPFGVLAAHNRLFTDPARPAGTRPYQTGDSVRLIDWKSSAHANTALVRRFQPAIALETIIALSFTREEYPTRFAYDVTERALSAAAAIAGHLTQLRQPVGLCTNGYDAAYDQLAPIIPSGNGRAHLMEVLGILGRLSLAKSEPILVRLRDATPYLNWGSTLIVITGARTEAIMTELIGLKRRGINIVLILTEPDRQDLEFLREYGIMSYGLWNDNTIHK